MKERIRLLCIELEREFGEMAIATANLASAGLAVTSGQMTKEMYLAMSSEAWDLFSEARDKVASEEGN